jgi:glyoxylate reductase
LNFNVFITRRIPQPGIEILRKQCRTVDINPHDRPLTREELQHEVRGRDAVLCLLTDTIDDDIFKAADRARIFANCAVGYNNIDVDAATRRGIIVTNTPGVLTETTADLTWALIFAVARRIAECDRFTRAGKFKGWGPLLLLGTEVTGKTLGIVGAGRIGTAVAKRSVGFDMKILYTDTVRNNEMEEAVKAERTGLDDLLQRSDFVSLHVPLLPETIHLIGSREFRLMKKSAFLINTCRGPVVDEKAFVEALKSREIGGAGVDVYENEPRLEPGLIELDNVVLLPHIGSATVETRTKMATMAAENLIAGLKGEKPPNLVNPEVISKH